MEVGGQPATRGDVGLSRRWADPISDIGGWNGPVFANLDGWGADTNYEVVERIALQQSSEVLITFQDQFFIRFARGQQESGDRVFGHSGWRTVDELPTSETRLYLLDLYRDGLHKAGFTFVLTFEMIDERGNSLHLFFGTTNEVAVEKFKDGLWEGDGVAGQRFRDPRDPEQLSFDILEPDFRPIDLGLLRLLKQRRQTMTELCRYALLETIYKKTHVKPAIDRLIEQRKARIAVTGRSYTEKVVELAPATLF